MKYKKIIITIMFVIFLFSITSISASEINTPMVSEDTGQLELSVNEECIGNNLQEGEENSTLTLIDNEETLSVQTDTDVLGTDSAKYSDLDKEIRQSGHITLKHKNYTYDNGATTIYIGASKVIDGNGAVIDMAGSTIRAFTAAPGVTIKNLTIKNTNYNGGVGGAIYFIQSGTVTNCNFTNNTASGFNAKGGAIYFKDSGTVTNCNFNKNTAPEGGAVYFNVGGTVTKCNFTYNTASKQNGGAVHFFNGGGTVTNCNFNNNIAPHDGGAVYFQSTGTVTNCNFNNNIARYSDGGAVSFYYGGGTVTNCNFNNNTASKHNGGAILLYYGTVSNCNFTGNNATTGSAIYFDDTSYTKKVFNSRFLNNRANAEALKVTKNDNKITITFTGKNNLLNAIYSDNDVNFTNVAYWSANGIANTGSSTTIPSRSNREAGQNITVSVVVNGKLILNEVKATDENGMIVLDNINTGENYLISVRHDADSYYTEAVQTISNNIKFNVNVTSQTTNNRTVNITAKSNIPNEIIKGELRFIVPNSNQIIANYAGNGTWWILHTFDDYGVYQVNATYVGLDKVTVNNATITISKIQTEITIVNSSVDLLARDSVATGAILTPADAGNLTYTSNNESVAKVEDGKIIAVGEGSANITVSFNGSEDYAAAENKTITVNVKRVATKVTVENVTAHPGDKINISVNITADDKSALKGNVNVTLPDGKSNTTEIINGEGNIIWTVPDNYTEGNYTIKVSYLGDDRYKPYEAEGKVNIIRYNSKVTISPIEDVDYRNNVTIEYSIENRTTVNVIIDGVSEDKIIITNDTITVIGLNAEKYTITILNNENNKYESSNDTKEFNVNKIDSTLNITDIVFDYNSTGSTTLSYDGATDVNAFVVNHPEAIVNVKDKKIEVSGLDVGTYTFNVTTVPDVNHNPVTKYATITVNKIDSTLIVDDVEFDYNSTGSTNITFNGTTGVNASVINHTVAIVNIKDDEIEISGLNAGTYTLTVTTIPDANHNPVTKNATITVNKIDSTLIVDNVVFDYNSTGSADVTFDGATGINASVINHTEAIINFKDNEIEISGLNAGTYTLTVTTIPDANHNPVTKNATITVNKIDSILNVDNIEFDYNTTGSTNITFDGATSVNTSVINHTEAIVNIKDNKIEISKLNAGTYTLTVTTIPDTNHNPVTKNVTITVNRVDSSLSVDNIIFDYNSTGSTNITFDGATGVNALVVNQSTAIINVKDNKIEISKLNAGTYTLTVTTIPDTNHNPVTKNVTITVNKVDSSLSVDNIIFDYNSTGSTNITFDGATGVNALVVNQSTAIVNVKENKIEVSCLDVGTYTLTVTTIPDTNHNPVTKNVTITVNRADSSLSVGNMVFDYNSSGSSNVTFGGATGVNANVVNHTEAIVNVKDNKIEISKLNAGTYTLTVTTIPDANHNPVTKNATITVNKVDSSLTVDNIIFDYNSMGSTNITFDGATGVNASVVNHTEAIVNVKDNKIEISKLNAGTYTLTVTTIPDANHNPVTKNATITVNKLKTELAGDAINTTYYIVKDLVISLKDINGNPLSGKNVSVDLDGVKVYGSDVNGQIKVSTGGLAPNSYVAKVTFDGDVNYEKSTAEIDVTITVGKLLVSAPELIKYDSGPEQFVVNVSSAEGKPMADMKVNITINGVTYTRTTNNDGVASLNVGLGSGEYPVNVLVDGIEVNSTVTVKSTIDANDLVKVFRNASQYSATFVDGNGTPLVNALVSFNIHGIIYHRLTDENGSAKLNINLEAGDYTLTATNPVTGEMRSNLIKVISLIDSSNLTKYYRNASQFVVRIHSSDGGYAGAGEEVEFNINGVIYTRTTNATGHAVLNINLGQGNYTITTDYKNCSQGNNIEVLPILSADNLVMKYMNGSQFKARLLDGQGKAYSNQTVTFNIHGVFYDRVTDSDGVAKLNIRLMAGEYIITSSYNDCNIANTIKITA